MADPGLTDVLLRLDRVLAELAEVRSALAQHLTPAPVAEETDDMAEPNLIDTFAAQQRFGHPADSIRKWCRTEGLGVRRGGRWLVDVRKLRARLNGGEA